MKKIISAIVIIIIFIIGLFMYIAIYKVNPEDLEYNTNFPQITPDKIKKENPNSLIIFIDPSCPGASRFGPKIKKGTDMLDSLNIPYYLIADILYSASGDKKLSAFIKKYNYDHKPIYIMDVKKYPKNSGIFNVRRRLKEFIRDICASCDTLSYGPGLHVFLKNGKFAKAKLTYELKPEDIEIYKK